MKNRGIDNAKVGLFVMAGLLFLVVTLYMIGRNRNMLGSTFTIKAVVSNVNGLVPGNNVRYLGIDVGTVKSIRLVNDSSIFVTLVIDDKMKPYIRKNALAAIGTDGVMGNKLININSQSGDAELVQAGDTIASQPPVQTDEMLRTLNTTNDNIERITNNLFDISERLNRNNSLWTLLSDTIIATDFKKTIAMLENTTANTAEITQSGKVLMKKFEKGKGIVPRLLTDSTLATQLVNSAGQIEQASEETKLLAIELKEAVNVLTRGSGTTGLLMSDTAFRELIFRSGMHLEEGAGRFSENMEALKSNILFRRYFKKQLKQKKDTVETRNSP